MVPIRRQMESWVEYLAVELPLSARAVTRPGGAKVGYQATQQFGAIERRPETSLHCFADSQNMTRLQRTAKFRRLWGT